MREMKDSGVAWINEFPHSWTIRRLRFLCIIATGSQDTQDNDQEGEYPFYVRSPIVERSKSYTFEGPAILMAGDGVGAGKIFHLVDGKYGCHQRVYSLQSIHDVDRRFLYYYLQNTFFISIDTANSKSTVDSVRLPMLQDYPVPIPPAGEQRRIADYLDAQCARIDRVIARQQEVIEKLKEYKLAVITEAVTKGLNPGVPMKDSGIEICSIIPATWKIQRIKHLFKLRTERNFEPLEDITLLSLYTDIGVFPHGEQEERGNKAVTAEGYKIVAQNDIVVNIILAWMGAIGISNYNGVTSPAYDIYIPINGTISGYYHYLFRTKAFSAECYRNGRGIMEMRWRTYSAEFSNIFVPVPPTDEQSVIADYLNKKTGEVDAIILRKASVVSKLTEYKKSLIYEVVTGKREV